MKHITRIVAFAAAAWLLVSYAAVLAGQEHGGELAAWNAYRLLLMMFV